jgi:hypothetical protein
VLILGVARGVVTYNAARDTGSEAPAKAEVEDGATGIAI